MLPPQWRLKACMDVNVHGHCMDMDVDGLGQQKSFPCRSLIKTMNLDQITKIFLHFLVHFCTIGLSKLMNFIFLVEPRSTNNLVRYRSVRCTTVHVHLKMIRHTLLCIWPIDIGDFMVRISGISVHPLFANKMFVSGRRPQNTSIFFSVSTLNCCYMQICIELALSHFN